MSAKAVRNSEIRTSTVRPRLSASQRTTSSGKAEAFNIPGSPKVRPHFLGVTKCNRASCGQFQPHMARGHRCHLSGTLPVASNFRGSSPGRDRARTRQVDCAGYPPSALFNFFVLLSHDAACLRDPLRTAARKPGLIPGTIQASVRVFGNGGSS